jgi:hypothetical protein
MVITESRLNQTNVNSRVRILISIISCKPMPSTLVCRHLSDSLSLLNLSVHTLLSVHCNVNEPQPRPLFVPIKRPSRPGECTDNETPLVPLTEPYRTLVYSDIHYYIRDCIIPMRQIYKCSIKFEYNSTNLRCPDDCRNGLKTSKYFPLFLFFEIRLKVWFRPVEKWHFYSYVV